MKDQMGSPYFGICIPVYNGESFIQEAIESVLRQTFPNWHLVIIDNQSIDRTWDLLQEKYASHPDITLHRNAKNLGLTGNLNRALELAQGEWWGTLPADDTYPPHALETIYRETRSAPDLVLWTHAHLVHGPGIVPNICPVFRQQVCFDAEFLAEWLFLRGNIFGELSSYFARVEACRGLYFEGSSQSTDIRFWIALLMSQRLRGKAQYWPDVLAHVHQHAASESSVNTRAGTHVADLFLTAEELSFLPWRRRIFLQQTFRLLWCWLRFSGALPRRTALRSLASIAHIIARMCRQKTSLSI